jgi:putative ATP-dependent endonuclease of the OLD family
MHRLVEVTVRNYRSIKEWTFPLSDFTPLVGYNNAGKSNLLGAIAWFLRPVALQETDFYDKGNRIVVEGKVEGVNAGVLDGLDQKHRKKVEPFVENETVYLRQTQSTPIDKKSQIKLEVLDPKVNDPKSPDRWKPNPGGISQAIQALFPEPVLVEAMKDTAEDVMKFKAGTTIGRLVKHITDDLIAQHGDDVRVALTDLHEKLDADGKNRPEELTEFDNSVSHIIGEFFSGIDLRITIPIPQLDDLLKSATVAIYEAGTRRKFDALGHGAQRAIQMALIQYLSDVQRTDNTKPTRTLLIVEEPELYLHPHGIEQVRAALKKLSKGAYQVLAASHSPQFIAPEDVKHCLLVRKTPEDGTFARATLSQAVELACKGAPAQKRTLFSLSNSSELLFADKLLLVEGTTEHAVFPALFEKVRKRTSPPGLDLPLVLACS